MMRLVRLAIVLMAVSSLSADTGPDVFLAKGFQPNMAYHVNEFDAINTMNGNLIVRIPLGPEFKTNGTLKYSFGLNFNGDFWWFINHPNGPNTTPLGPESRNFSIVVSALDGQGSGLEGTEAIPSGNAGIGWGVETPSYGESTGYSYLSGGFNEPDGASHQLTPEMHHSVGPTVPNPDLSYSKDNSYYRVRRSAPTADNRPTREVHGPDGIVYRFSCVSLTVADCTAYQKNAYLLDWMADPYGNVLLIERTSNGQPSPSQPAFTEWVWEYTEGTLPNGEGRTNVYFTGSQADRNNLKVIRKHWLHFDRVNPGNPNEPVDGRRWQTRLTKAVISGVGSDPLNPNTVTYTPVYKLKKIFRLPVFPHDCPGGVSPCDTLLIQYEPDKSIKVWVLDRVELPSGGGSWKFDYYTTDPNDIAPKGTFSGFDNEAYRGGDRGTSPANHGNCCVEYPPLPNGAKLQQGNPEISQANEPTFYYEWKVPYHSSIIVYPTSKIGGRLRRVTAPTGGGYKYTYGLRLYPTTGCRVPIAERRNHPAVLMVGVAKRQQFNENGPAGSPWVYSGAAYRDPQNFCTSFRGEFIGAVLDPNGKLTLNFFNVKDRDPFFSAPISPVRSRTSPFDDSRQLALSSRTYAVDYNSYSADLNDKVRVLVGMYGGSGDPGATALRSEWAKYEMSSSTCGMPDSETYCDVFNLRRVATLRTFEGDQDEGSYIETVNSGYDGLGNFRQVDVWSNLRQRSQLNIGQQERRRTFQNFNPGVTFNGIDNPTGMPEATQPWIIRNYGHITTWENAQSPNRDGSVSHARFFFDPQRGFLAAKRSVTTFTRAAMPATLAESELALTPKDFLVTYERSSDDTGTYPRVKVMETYYGGTNRGDNGVLGTTWLSNGRPSTNNAIRDYAILNQYQFGGLAKTEYLNQCDSVSLQSYAAVIDRRNGLPASEIDSSGLAMQYQYDGLNRIVVATPPSPEKPQNYQYSVLTGAGARNNITVTRDNGPRYEYDYDHLGRMIAERHSIPDGAGSYKMARRYSHYNLFDKPLWESVWLFGTPYPIDPANPTFKVQRFTYDVFNRVIQTIAPDNIVTDTFYKGDRQIDVKSNNVAINASGNGTAWHTTNKDAFGRVSEASDSVLHAQYDYDVADHISLVTLNPVGDSNTKQWRRFDYDGTGTLILEAHPELDNYTIRHEKIDARGHAHRMAVRTGDGPNAAEDASRGLRFELSSDERLSKVRSATNEVLKEFTYYPLNCTSSCDGVERTRLATATRHNRIPNPRGLASGLDVVVKDTYHYDAFTGRMTSVETTANGSAGTTPDTMYSFSISGKMQYGYDQLGQLKTVNWPAGNAALGPARSITNTWEQGMLTRVQQTAPLAADRASILYADPTGIPTQVTYGHPQVKDTTVVDPNGLPRVNRITWSRADGSTTAGDYYYDGRGNIKRIERSNGMSETFLYDAASRLVDATVGGKHQKYVYDPFGNLKGFELHQPRSFPVSTASNRMTSHGYDASGNVTHMPDARRIADHTNRFLDFTYDPFNSMTSIDTGKVGTVADANDFGRLFVYNANDERVGVIHFRESAGVREQWSFRDAANHVVRDLERRPGSGWAWTKDYIFRGGALNTTVAPGEVTRDAHLDHLGTTRLLTNAAGGTVEGERLYLPFGEPPQKIPLAERLAFTGHERDESATAGAPEADFDYMHARYYSGYLGRFLSVDPGRDVDAKHPQSWNLYGYVRNSPLTAADPSGRETCVAAAASEPPTPPRTFKESMTDVAIVAAPAYTAVSVEVSGLAALWSAFKMSASVSVATEAGDAIFGTEDKSAGQRIANATVSTGVGTVTGGLVSPIEKARPIVAASASAFVSQAKPTTFQDKLAQWIDKILTIPDTGSYGQSGGERLNMPWARKEGPKESP
ncbi:MAG TPA: RHS repeat-associated core domain-containing protein [Thermoanaerobaculia bacterium]|nr:RHS repeat-associated core domain-containing protein [Thermoanaerobaculia bacterium]